MAVQESIISPRDGGKRAGLTEEDIADRRIRPGTFWNAYSFGICLVFTNIVIAWSAGLANGYWDFLISLIFISTAFICLHLCIAEMVSILPFSGKFPIVFEYFRSFRVNRWYLWFCSCHSWSIRWVSCWVLRVDHQYCLYIDRSYANRNYNYVYF